MAEKRRGGGMFIGGPLILVVFVALCLTTFAALSMVSARADAKLARRAADGTGAFYAADAAAESQLSLVDEYLRTSWTLCLELPDEERADAYLARVLRLSSAMAGVSSERTEDGCLVSYAVPVDETRDLQVDLEVPAPPGAGARYRRARWQVVYAADWEGDEDLLLWSGGGLPDLAASEGM